MLNCLGYVTDCPTRKSTLYPAFFKKIAWPLTIAILGIVIYLGTIGVSKITGYWVSAYETLEQKALEGELTPDDIKNSNTLIEVADIFDLNLDELYERLNLDKDLIPESTRLRDIKNLIDAEYFGRVCKGCSKGYAGNTCGCGGTLIYGEEDCRDGYRAIAGRF